MKSSGLRGRGGAGFPTGLKWSLHAEGKEEAPLPVRERRRVGAGDLQGPRDHALDPARLLEGTLIAMHAIQADVGYIYIRGEFTEPLAIMEKALAEAYAGGSGEMLGTGFEVDIYVHRGAGAYICGEETALMNSLEGKRGNPRIKPPFPATSGVFGCPTIVNNVETLAAVPPIIEARRRVVQGDRAFQSEEPRHQALLRLRPRAPARQLRSDDGLPAQGPGVRRRRRNASREARSRP